MKTCQLVHHTALSEFNFIQEEHVYRGAFYHNHLYKLVAEYRAHDRQTAFALAIALEQQGLPVIISVEVGMIRKVWVEVKSLIEPLPLARLNFGQSPDEALMPEVVNCCELSEFKFTRHHQVHQGALYQGQLYELINEYDRHHYHDLLTTAQVMTEQGHTVLISVELQNNYQLWVGMRPVLADPNEPDCDNACPLPASLRSPVPTRPVDAAPCRSNDHSIAPPRPMGGQPAINMRSQRSRSRRALA